MVFGSFIVSHFESFWVAVYTSPLKRALDRQQQSKHTHKVQCVPCHNKLSKTIRPCTTCSTSKGTLIRNSETWCAVTVWAGESERATLSCHDNSCWGAHNQNTGKLLQLYYWRSSGKKMLSVDMYQLKCVFQLINNSRSHKTLSSNYFKLENSVHVRKRLRDTFPNIKGLHDGGDIKRQIQKEEFRRICHQICEIVTFTTNEVFIFSLFLNSNPKLVTYI